MTKARARVELRSIPVALIDPPDVVMREKMTDGGLDALVESLQRHGQLQNIGVVENGSRFRVAYGHRRRVAAERAGLTELVCRVFPAGTPDEEAMKVDENEEQEPVNAAAQATYYFHLLQNRCDNDVEKLLKLVRRKESFVLDRLDLIRGDDDVLDALRHNRIPLNTARELNKVSEPMYRRLWLHDAVHLGINARNIKTLRINRDRDRHVTEGQASGTPLSVAPSTEPSLESLDACLLCHSTTDQHDMSYRKVHRSCETVWRRNKNDPGNDGQAEK
jgi:ParB/RepB/Spo0J family partition protein